MSDTVDENEPQSVEEDPMNDFGAHLNDIMNRIGFGKWTMLYFTVAVLGTISELANLLISPFSSPSLQFWCNVTALGELTDDFLVTSNRSECEVERRGANGSLSLEPCTQFVYNTSMFTTTVTAEFDLVCARSWYRELFQMLFTLGCVVGAPLGGLLCDMYGRQRLVFYGSVLMTVCTAVLSTTSSIWVLFVSRFLLGIFSHITFAPAITLGIEGCPSSLRTLYGTVESVPYAIVLPLLATIAYFCRVWRHLQLYSSIPLFLMLVLSCPLVMDESPRWLISRGKLEESEKVIRRAARLNNSEDKLPKDLHNQLKLAHLEEKPSESTKAKLWSLVSTAEMRKITFVTMALWFCEGVLYLTLPLETDTYKSPFLYMALLGLLEIPASFILVPISSKCGRIKTSVVSAVLTGALLAALTMYRSSNYDNEWVLLSTAVVAYMTLVGISQMLILLTSELFPTTVRGVGTSLGLFMANLTYNLPPLFKAVIPPSLPWVPFAINSLLAFLSAILVLTLPETLDRPLMQTVEQHVGYEQEKKRKKVNSYGSRKTGADLLPSYEGSLGTEPLLSVDIED